MCVHPNHKLSSTTEIVQPTLTLTNKLDLDWNKCDYEDCSETSENLTKDSELNVLHYNIRGILNKQNELADFLSNCGGKEIHVALLNETWLKKSNTERVKIQGYELVGIPRPHKTGGGVGILINKKLKYRKITEDIPSVENFEVCVVELKLSNSSVLLVSLYRPPNSNIPKFLEEYNQLLHWLSRKKCPVIIGCDHNLDLLKLDLHRNTEQFVDLNLDSELIPCITKPTRITKSTATLIDNVFVSNSLHDQVWPSIMLNDMSDHLPCRVIIENMYPLRNKTVTKEIRLIKKGKVEQTIKEINSVNWSTELHDRTSINSAFEYFTERVTKCIEENLPTIKINVNKKRPTRPWLNKSLHNCITKSKKLFAKTLSKNSVTTDHENYVKYRNVLNTAKRKAMQLYFMNKCIEFKENGKKLWRIIRKASQTLNDKTSIVNCLEIEGIKHFESRIIANELGSFFSSIGKNYANKIDNPKKTIASYLKTIDKANDSIYLDPTNNLEIDRIISSLQSKTSHGHDGLTNKLLKELKPALIPPLCILFNMSLTNGIFPDIYKKSDVVPLHKSKSRTYVNNYRPISLLPVISKILEKIMHKRIYSFLNRNNSLYISQYGFRPKHSCENAITELCSSIIKEKEKGFHTLALFLDLSKAFDTLNHEILLQKLYIYGIRGVAYQWFKSYLENRTMRVKCLTEDGLIYSANQKVDFGAPQGSCLGPLLFLIYTNDIHKHLEFTKCILFADDTTLYYSHRNLNYLKYCIEHDLGIIVDWFKANGLTLNLDKSECVLFRPKSNKSESFINIDVEGIKIPFVARLNSWVCGLTMTYPGTCMLGT